MKVYSKHFLENVGSPASARAQIYLYLNKKGPTPTHILAEKLNLKINCVVTRVNELRNRRMINSMGYVVSPKGRPVHAWGVTRKLEEFLVTK